MPDIDNELIGRLEALDGFVEEQDGGCGWVLSDAATAEVVIVKYSDPEIPPCRPGDRVVMQFWVTGMPSPSFVLEMSFAEAVEHLERGQKLHAYEG